MDTPKGGPFDLVSYRLGALPLVNHFLDRIGLDALLTRWLPPPDRRFRLDPVVVIGLIVVNLLIGRAPLYGLGEWAAPYDPGLLGLRDGDAAWLNDDRAGRALDRLFDMWTPRRCTTTPPRSACTGPTATPTVRPVVVSPRRW